MHIVAGLVALCSLAANASGTTIHIDPSRTDGCPGAGTLSDPYCDWDSVTNFRGGYRYLQKRDTTYRKILSIAGGTDASPSRPIYIGAYGSGGNPRIRIENSLPFWNNPATWKRAGAHEWAYRTAKFAIGDPQVLFLDGRRAFGKARRKEDMCIRKGTQRVEWFHENDTLYLCSPTGNPATVFSSMSGMQVASGSNFAAIYIKNKHDIVIDDFTLEGGWYGAIFVRGGSHDIEIRNSTIGRDSANGVRVIADEIPARRIRIHHNIIDSGIRWGRAGYEPLLSGEGVQFLMGVEDSRVDNNVIVAWSHAGTYLFSKTPSKLQVRNNMIQDNEYHCGPNSSYFDYCRPIIAEGERIGDVRGNIFFRNRMHDFSVRSQINGDHNSVIGNVCYHTVNSDAKTHPTGQCFSIQPYGTSEHNVFANNTMYDTADVAIEFVPGNAGPASLHQVINNIMQNCAADATNGRRNACIFVGSDASIGPQIISHNLVYNDWGAARIEIRGRDFRKHSSHPEVTQSQNYESDEMNLNWINDPKLRDPARGDFSLAPNSPAIQKGIKITVPRSIVGYDSSDLGAIPFRQIESDGQ